MPKRYLTLSANGTLDITQIVGDDTGGDKLAKALFELSRTSDSTQFDSAVHTRNAIASGRSGHRSLALSAECEYSDLPVDRYFRSAWEWVEGVMQISVNLSKAQEIHMGEIRKVRDAQLIKTDVPFLRAVEAGDTNSQATIAAEKQTLRDIPQKFDLRAARTPELLKGLWPVELPTRPA